MYQLREHKTKNTKSYYMHTSLATTIAWHQWFSIYSPVDISQVLGRRSINEKPESQAITTGAKLDEGTCSDVVSIARRCNTIFPTVFPLVPKFCQSEEIFFHAESR